MAKGNLFLGYGRGKVGDVVLSRQNGEQVTRARNRAPRNPQSPLQMLQRVIMKTSATAYSMLSPICDHAFQGYQPGTPNQSRFAALNVALMRNQMRDAINSGDPEEILASQEFNFANKNSLYPQIRDYQISEGTLNSLTIMWDGFMPYIKGTGLAPEGGATYQQVVDALGLQKGDQLTFVMLGVDDRSGVETSEFTTLKYCRVILEPNDGDMTSKFLAGTGGVTGAVNKPNERNLGTIEFQATSGQGLFVVIPGFNEAGGGDAVTAAGFAVIVSRLVGNVWQRSSERINVAAGPFNVDHNIGYLQDAIYSYLSGADSTLYLNQAE